MSFSGLQAHPKEFESPYTKILLACLFSEENTGSGELKRIVESPRNERRLRGIVSPSICLHHKNSFLLNPILFMDG